MIKKGGVEFATSLSHWEARPAALTNNKQENVDQMHADNVIKQLCEFRFNPKKNLPQPLLSLYLSMHINKLHRSRYPVPFKSFCCL
jgi:hypothetical protein